jgi:hypothetical protein
MLTEAAGVVPKFGSFAAEQSERSWSDGCLFQGCAIICEGMRALYVRGTDKHVSEGRSGECKDR